MSALTSDDKILIPFDIKSYEHPTEVHEKSTSFPGKKHTFILFKDEDGKFRKIHVDKNSSGKVKVLEAEFNFKDKDDKDKELWVKRYDSEDLFPPEEILARARKLREQDWEYSPSNHCQHFTRLCILRNYAQIHNKYKVDEEYAHVSDTLCCFLSDKVAGMMGGGWGSAVTGVATYLVAKKIEEKVIKAVTSSCQQQLITSLYGKIKENFI